MPWPLWHSYIRVCCVILHNWLKQQIYGMCQTDCKFTYALTFVLCWRVLQMHDCRYCSAEGQERSTAPTRGGGLCGGRDVRMIKLDRWSQDLRGGHHLWKHTEIQKYYSCTLLSLVHEYSERRHFNKSFLCSLKNTIINIFRSNQHKDRCQLQCYMKCRSVQSWV